MNSYLRHSHWINLRWQSCCVLSEPAKLDLQRCDQEHQLCWELQLSLLPSPVGGWVSGWVGEWVGGWVSEWVSELVSVYRCVCVEVCVSVSDHVQTCTLHNVLEACQDVKWEVSQTCYWLWLAQEVTRRTDWGSLVSWNVTAPPIVYLIVSLTHSHTHTHIHTHTHTHTSTHTHLYTHTHTQTDTHPLHTHIHTHTHTQTDRHTHTLPSLSPKHNSSTVIHATSKALPAH